MAQGEFPERFRRLAEQTKGFMPVAEGEFLYQSALTALRHGPGLEIGSYCGLSGLYLGAAAEQTGQVLFTVDHHRGSEEIQPGWAHHDPDLVDPTSGQMNSLPFLRKTIQAARLTKVLLPIVGRSVEVAKNWTRPLGLLFIDGGHSQAEAHGDYAAWIGRLAPGGHLLIHDVFADPAEGGQAPFEIYQQALQDGLTEVGSCGSLWALRCNAGTSTSQPSS